LCLVGAAILISRTIKSVKNLTAEALGRFDGLKGGRARANKLSPERRLAIAKKAAQARWGKSTVA